MTLSNMRARIQRLRNLAHGMGKEVAIWQAQEGLLLPLVFRSGLILVIAARTSGTPPGISA